MAGGPGFEPGLEESESTVLPLNYPPTGRSIHNPRDRTAPVPAWRLRAWAVRYAECRGRSTVRSAVDAAPGASITGTPLLRPGRVAEWFKAAVLKTAVGATPPWVRIPPLPPDQNTLRASGRHLCGIQGSRHGPVVAVEAASSIRASEHVSGARMLRRNVDRSGVRAPTIPLITQIPREFTRP